MRDARKKIRVCFIVRHSHLAGTEKHVYLLTTHLNKNFIEPHVLILEEGQLGKMLCDNGIRITVIPNSKSIIHYLKLITFFARGKFDIIHCHSGGYACLAAKITGAKRIVYTKHGIGATKEELEHRPFTRRLRDILINFCVIRYIALTEYDKYIMTSVLHIKNKIIRIVNNGIDPAFKFMNSRRNKTYPLIGMVGRLAKQKGISYLIEAIPMIAEKYDKLRVIIAGNGEEEETLKNLARQLKVIERIDFLGYVENPMDIISQLDVFVLPSVWEGFPYVLLEAMLFKKPIVASNIFGINEIIKNGVDGVLVEPRCPEGIGNAAIDLLSNKEKSQKMGEAAYKKVITKYTLKNTASEIEKLYVTLMEKVPRPCSPNGSG